MEQPPHFKHLTPEQVHAARTKTYLAKPDLSLPPKSKSCLGVGNTPKYAAALAALNALKNRKRPEVGH
jgi:hypothetical protein